MLKEKFNPIAELPILPGTEIANDELETNIIDSTYPPKPQIEIRVKPTVEEKVSKRLLIVRSVILLCLVVFVFLGIFLTLHIIPKVTNNISDFSKSFGSLFTRKNTPTSTTTPAYISLVATSTPIVPVVTPILSPMYAQSTTTAQQKAPVKLVANILSTNTLGNRTTIKFNIQNIGDTPSGVWSFSATLPSRMTPKYYSEVQSPLTPKSGVIYTLGFTADQYQNTPVQITLY